MDGFLGLIFKLIKIIIFVFFGIIMIPAIGITLVFQKPWMSLLK